jgi:hypothetical protein
MKPFLKSTPYSTLLFHQENTIEKYHFSNNSGIIYLHVCVLNFSSLFSFFPQKMQFGVIFLEVWGSTQPYVAFWTFKFNSCCFVYSRTHPAPSSLLSTGQCLLCLVSSLFIWLMDGTCLLCLVVWVQGTHPISYSRSLIIVSLNGWSDNFEPQEARMKKLLRMVNSRRRKNGLFVYF